MTLQDYNDVWEAWCYGLTGPYKDYSLSYYTSVGLHSIRETLVGVNSSKTYRPKEYPSFDKVFPTIDEMQRLGVKPREAGLSVSLGDHVPDWVKDKFKE